MKVDSTVYKVSYFYKDFVFEKQVLGSNLVSLLKDLSDRGYRKTRIRRII